MKAQEIALKLSEQADTIVRHLLPNGVLNGHDWCVGSINGEAGRSLKVCLSGDKVGVWKDFASVEGGDLLDLWCQTKNITLSEAIKEASSYLGISTPPIIHKQRAYKQPRKPKTMAPVKKTTEALKYLTEKRGLTLKTLEDFMICGDNEKIYFPFLHNGKAKMIKELKLERVNGKKDCRVTSGNQMSCLMGWQTINPGVREVVICEGEINAMSVYQAEHDALAVPYGAGGGEKQAWVENEYDRLERFDIIYLWFDKDPAGEEAIPELLMRLGRERCRIIESPIDANDQLLKGLDKVKMDKLKSMSKDQSPESLARMSEYADKAWQNISDPKAYAKGFRLPWAKCGDSFVFRPSEITVLSGVNSHGKSAGVGQITVGVMQAGGKVCIASMESQPHKWSVKMLRQYCSMTGLTLPKNRGEFDDMWQWFNNSMFAYSSPGRGICSDILEVFKYARKRYGVTFFVIDNLSALDVAMDDYEGQRNFTQDLVNFAKTEDVHILFVAHQRKPLSEAESGSRLDIKGSGSLSDLADNALIWWRNKSKEKKFNAGEPIDVNEPDALLICDKQKETGVERTYKLWFHAPTVTFFESPEIVKEQTVQGGWGRFD